MVYLICATFLLLASVELALWGLDRHSPGRFPILEVDDYPSHPENYVKIAVFGESSAKGQGAERGPADVIRYHMQLQFPDRKFYLRNYARPGAFFHGYQAEMAKANMSRYDIIVLYAGHNEAHTILDVNGFFRKPEYKDVLDYIISVGCQYYFKYLPLQKLGLPVPENGNK